MKKRIITGLTALFLSAATIVGCSGNPAGSSSAGPTGDSSAASEAAPVSSSGIDNSKEVTLKIHAIVNPQNDEATVFDALNQLTKEKLNTKVNYLFHGGSYADKIQVIIASGEEYDICFTASWLNNYSSNAAKGAFADITDMLELTPALKSEIPQYMWDAAKIKGKIYAVPNQQIVARALPIMAPKEYIEGTNTDVSKIGKISDLADYLVKAKEKYGARYNGQALNELADLNGYELLLDGYTGGAIKMDDASATVVNFFETPEFKDSLMQIAELYQKGLVDSECVTNQEYRESQRKAKKTSATLSGTYKPGGDVEESVRAGYDCILEPLAGIKPYVSTGSVIATMQAISNSSKNPERALQYLEFLNTSSDAMNLLSYGVEGKHYEKVSGNVIKTIPDSGYAPGASWAIGNVFKTYVVQGQPEDVWEQTKKMNDTAVTSPVLGFIFDPEPVKLQVTSVTKIATEYTALGGGSLDVEKSLTEMNDKMKVAGMDDIIAEMQKQVTEFLKSK